MKFEKIQDVWEKEKNNLDQKKYTMEQLSIILRKKSTGVTLNLAKGIKLSTAINIMLMVGLIFLFVRFGGDKVSSLISLFILFVILIFEVLILSAWRKLHALDISNDNLKSTLKKIIGFFNDNYIWVIWSLGLSGVFIYVIGGLIYHNFKYGFVRLDTLDILVNLIFILIAFSIGFFSHKRAHFYYRRELEICLSDLDSDEISPEHDRLHRIIRKRNYTMRWLVLLGILVLFLLILFFKIF